MAGSFVARVVPVRARRAHAWAVALASAALVVTLLSTSSPHDDVLGVPTRAWLGLAMAGWSLGTILGMRPPRSRVVRARAERGRLALDGLDAIDAAQVRGLRVARGRVGFSVAVAGAREMFLEVERESDAHRVVEALGGLRDRACAFRLPLRLARWLQYAAGIPGLAAGLGYALVVGVLENGSYKELFGLGGILCALVSTIVFFLRPVLQRSYDVAGADVSALGPAAAHFALHRSAAASALTPASSRAILERRDEEPARAWLDRLDRLGDGYREEAAPQPEELVRIAEDEGALPDARLGAARLLARRHGGLPDRARVRLSEDLGAKRVRLATDGDPARAATALELIGPAFVARR